MNNFDLKGLDFQALETLRLVHNQRSFSLAAKALGQHQSTVSYAIDKLRDVFADPLFVRQGRSIAPTPRCDEIVLGIGRLFDQLADLVEPQSFEPNRSVAEITLSCNHYERSILLPRVVQRLRLEAPGLRLRIINARTRGHEQLHRGECDLLLSPIAGNANGLYRRHLLEDRYVCLLDPANPLAGGSLSLEQFAAARHIFISYEGSWRPRYAEMLEAQGIIPHIVVDLPSSADLQRFVGGTDLVATVSRLLALSLEPRLAVREGPFESMIRIDAYWSERTHRSPLHKWFRALLADEAAAVSNP